MYTKQQKPEWRLALDWSGGDLRFGKDSIFPKGGGSLL